jgi:hypothetical protein
MKLRERRNAERQDPPRGAGDGGGSNLEALSAAAERLRAAGDAAIDRVLSGNSAAWLMSNQQRGGQ